MYGDIATELIRHISREHGEIIPEYQYQLIERVMRENEELYAENLKTSQEAPKQQQVAVIKKNEPTEEEEQNRELLGSQEEDREELAISDNIDIGEKEIMVMQVRHTAKLWNKRCIIAYHYERLNRLKRLRWDYGNNLPREIVKNLSPQELDWFTKYNDNLFSYMSSLDDGRGLDLTLYMTPPKKLCIQVKCIKDYGEIDFEDGRGPMVLKKDNIYHLQLSACEKLIHQGFLEHLKS